MDQQQAKQQIVERVKGASSVLITASSNPSIDQVSAAIGLSFMLTKLGKHVSVVISGKLPPTLNFLEPEKTIDSTVDRLRDFVISLDKDKADKLRYKADGDVLKIFITPFKDPIQPEDVKFSQGELNVDVVLALGVHQQEELDEAIKAHGNILHDATVITINAGKPTQSIGQIDWSQEEASSISEMLVSISEAFEGGLLDQQISTAFLTGIVSETNQFLNQRTSPKVMTMAAQLMAAGANQQVIASNLGGTTSSPPAASQPKPTEELKPSQTSTPPQPATQPQPLDPTPEGTAKPEEKTESDETPEVTISEDGKFTSSEETEKPEEGETKKIVSTDTSLAGLQSEIDTLASSEQPSEKKTDKVEGTDIPSLEKVESDLNKAPAKDGPLNEVAQNVPVEVPKTEGDTALASSLQDKDPVQQVTNPGFSGALNAPPTEDSADKKFMSGQADNSTLLSHQAPPASGPAAPANIPQPSLPPASGPMSTANIPPQPSPTPDLGSLNTSLPESSGLPAGPPPAAPFGPPGLAAAPTLQPPAQAEVLVPPTPDQSPPLNVDDARQAVAQAAQQNPPDPRGNQAQMPPLVPGEEATLAQPVPPPIATPPAPNGPIQLSPNAPAPPQSATFGLPPLPAAPPQGQTPLEAPAPPPNIPNQNPAAERPSLGPPPAAPLGGSPMAPKVSPSNLGSFMPQQSDPNAAPADDPNQESPSGTGQNFVIGGGSTQAPKVEDSGPPSTGPPAGSLF